MSTRQLISLGASACALLLLVACDDDPPGHPWGAMYGELEAWLWNVDADGDPLGDYHDGDWDPDWDDAPFYGLAFYAASGWGDDNADHRARALEAASHNMDMARAGLADPLGEFIENISAILYGSLGMIDYIAVSGDDSQLETVDQVIEMANGALELMGDYVSGNENQYAIQTYGPTSITSIFALINLQHAVLLDTPDREARIERAVEILDVVDAYAWNGRFYQFNPDNTDDLYLYPNVAMIIALTRAYQATGEDRYLTRAEEVYGAIQALKYDHRPGYYSRYSAEFMGAQTDDYSTLSSTNYTMLALALLAQETGDPAYRAEIDELLGFVEDYLWVPNDGRVYHHWMDGRLAIPDDPEYYCIGCNLQLLYIVRWVHTVLET